MSYGYDTHILDVSGNKLVSYGPRRIEVERVVNGKSYVSYRQHHPEHDDPDIHVEACAPAEASFWGVYKHDAEGLASIVGDAHNQSSAKAFAELVARNLDLEARLASVVNATPSPPRIVLVMEGERIQSILADVPVEVTGLNYDEDEMDEAEDNGLNVVKVPQGDGTTARAVIGTYPVDVDAVETARIIALDVEGREPDETACVDPSRNGGEAASRALRLKQGLPRYIVDGHEFRNDESNFVGDGRYPPFVIFDVDLQENLPGEFGTRAEAEQVAALKNAEHSRWVILAIDTNTAAFKDLGHAHEAARLLRDAAMQLQHAGDLESVRLFDTNGNEVGWLHASDVLPDLGAPGMIHLLMETGEDYSFGTAQAERSALALAFHDIASHLDRESDLAKSPTTFKVEVRSQKFSSQQGGDVQAIKFGAFHYTPSLEPDVQLAPRAAGVPEI